MRDILKIFIFFVMFGLLIIIGYHINKFLQKKNSMQVEVTTDITHGLDQTTVEAGQIWIYESKNPFRSTSSMYYVIEVKQEYVKYCDVIDGKYDIERWISGSINMFKIGSRRIK